jgi:hypothetical protein
VLFYGRIKSYSSHKRTQMYKSVCFVQASSVYEDKENIAKKDIFVISIAKVGY